jgi:hypothetical protein
MDIELISAKPRNQVELSDDDELNTLFNESLVTGYKISTSRGQRIKLPPSASGYLFVSIDNATVDLDLEVPAHRVMKPGHYIWLDGKDPVTITTSMARFVLLQLK